MERPNSQTRICVSFSRKPGNFGSNFHGFLFERLDLNYIYLSRKISDIGAAVGAIRTLDIRGAGISMPFKGMVLEFLDEVDATSRRIGAVNTIVNDQGILRGYNTDYWAIKQLITSRSLDRAIPVSILGNGGMAAAVTVAFTDSGFEKVRVISRNRERGQPLAERLGVEWRAWAPESLEGILINATSLGFGEDVKFIFPLPDSQLAKFKEIWDVVASPALTNLVQRAVSLNILSVAGLQIAKRQAEKQFELYTGITPSAEMTAAAFEYTVKDRSEFSKKTIDEGGGYGST